MPSVVVERRGGVLEIILNRPEILNAVNRQTIAALADAVDEAAENPAARVVLLRGAGAHFCAGGAAEGALPHCRHPPPAADPDTAHAETGDRRGAGGRCRVWAQPGAGRRSRDRRRGYGLYLRVHPSRYQPRWRHDGDTPAYRRDQA